MHSDDKAETPLDEPLARRRNRMAGLWAAELLGLIGQAAHDYAHDLAHGGAHAADDSHLVHRLVRDLEGRVSAHEIKAKLAHFLHEARQQLLREQGGRKQD